MYVIHLIILLNIGRHDWQWKICIVLYCYLFNEKNELSQTFLN